MKKEIIIIAMFVIVTGVLIALIPVEKKQMLRDEYGKLAVNAETDEKSAYILENISEYPESILKTYYESDNNLDFVYNYPAHKNDYTIMSFTEDELNSETVPKLYMDDTRWCYEKLYGSYLKFSGCVPVCITMASLYLNGDGNLDPVIAAKIAEENYEAPFFGGVDVANIKDLAEKTGFTVTEHSFSEEGTLCDEQLIRDMLDNGEVILAGMVGNTFGEHAVIIADITDEGIVINDPASVEKSEKVWQFEEIQAEIYSLWGLSK